MHTDFALKLNCHNLMGKLLLNSDFDNAFRNIVVERFAKYNSHLTVHVRFSERDSGKVKYDQDQRGEASDGYTPASLVSTATTSHFPVPTLSSTITVVAPSHHHNNNTSESWSDFHPDHPVDHVPFVRAPPPPPPQQRKRCRDYDGDERRSFLCS